MDSHPISRRDAFLAFLGYLAFVIYGSLVPFAYRGISFEQAVARFREIGFLDLGVAARADWVANIVLYVPLSFLGCAFAIGMRSVHPLRHLTGLVVWAFCLAVAVAIEFFQEFFAPRTVSLNDLLAEAIGSTAGVVLFGLGRWEVVGLLRAFAAGGRVSVLAAMVLYLLCYVALSLFPYDFVVSPKELAWKLTTGNQGWLLASGDCTSWLRCGARQASEVVGLIPLGILLALGLPGWSLGRAFLLGVGLGLVLELLQLLLASGTSQGLSLLWRGLGLATGVAGGRLLRRYGPLPLAHLIRWLLPVAALPYGLLLVALAGWFSAPWLPPGDAFARLAELRLIPFYHHYFTTETAAMVSLIANAGMYAPLGLAVWALRAAGPGNFRHGARTAGLAAGALALPVELGKLFVPPKHPDLTNLLIAAGSAALVFVLTNWLARLLIGPPPGKSGAFIQPPAGGQAATPPLPTPQGLATGLALAGLLGVGLGLRHYPVGTPWLAAGLLAYGALLWHRPSLLFLTVPALLPTLDFSPYTGRLALDEFDLVVLLTLAIGYFRVYPLPARPWPGRAWPLAYGLLWCSWAVAMVRGLWPLWGLDGGGMDSSHSPLEAWQVGKGWLWALLLVPLLRRVPSANIPAVQRRLLDGWVLGLSGVVLAVVWERQAFVGLADFEREFRVTGSFSTMNRGSAYIETFLATAFPLLAVRVLQARRGLFKLAGLLAAALATYAMLVTFSRGGYAGMVAGLAPLGLALVRQSRGLSPRRWLVPAGLAMASLVAAVPVLSGGFAQSRLAHTADDLAVRQAHWRRALELMDPGPLPALLGMGFGQYPLLYLTRADGVRPPGTYSVLQEGTNRYLRLGSGTAAFLDQIVALAPDAQYTLSLRLRQPDAPAAAGVALCQKALLYSFECLWPRLPPPDPEHRWSTVSVPIDPAPLNGDAWPPRTVKLSLHNGSRAPIDLDGISLKRRDGRELVANGGFDEGTARWLFVSDDGWAWHIEQQVLEVYFAQGWLGVLALAAVIAAAAGILWPALARGDLAAAGFAGALVAFLTVGLFGSAFDTARLALMFYFTAFAAGFLVQPVRAPRRAGDGSTP
ncbi:VanZ family protein [Candidatus Methylocalor cossyra]|uniref:O-antigen ligase-like membrane protein n=1 Tax=Candidatus Methylocalor cossyra TaxID=3108543 RepID=A0ABM9NFL0_9GAMM